MSNKLDIDTAGMYKRSFTIFCREAMGHLIGDFHIEIINRLMTEVNKPGPKIHQCIMVSRGHSKTTIFSCDFSLWFILRATKPTTVLIESMNQSMSRRILGLIRAQLHSCPVFSKYKFKTDTADSIELYVPGHEGDDRFVHTIASIPVGTRGPHADLIISDDILKDEKGNSATNVIQLKELWWKTAFPMCAIKKGIHLVVGTPISGDDIFVDIDEIAKEKETWRLYKYPAILDEGTENERALFPELQSLDDEYATRDSCPTYVWDREYMLRNISTANSMFPEEIIKQCVDQDLTKIENFYDMKRDYYIGWDVALGEKKSSDYSAIVVVSKAPRGPILLEEIWHEQGMDEVEQEKLVMRLTQKYRITKGLIEKKGLSESLARKVMLNPSLSPYFEEYNPTNNSKANILGNLNLLMKHRMFNIDSNIAYTSKLIEELRLFGIINRNGNQTYQATSGHDDLVIGLALAVSAAGGWAFDEDVPTTIEII